MNTPDGVACPHCSSATTPFVEVFDEALNRCTVCDLVFVASRPDRDEMIRRHLTKEYAEHPYFVAGEAAADQGGIELHRLVMNRLQSTLPKQAAILDVGAGTGDFLKLAASEYDVAAIEPSQILADRICDRVGCPVYVGSFESYDRPESCDALLLMDIIEHAADPRSLLAQAYRTLRPGGTLFVCTVDSRAVLYRMAPLIARLAIRWKKAAYVLHRIFCYQHNWYFNRRVLRSIVSEAGFSVSEHRGFEFPLSRLRESPLIKAGLRVLYVLQWLLGAQAEQYLVARKPERAEMTKKIALDESLRARGLVA